MKKTALICATLILSLLLCVLVGGMRSGNVCAAEVKDRESLGDLTVLMYHNTLAPHKKECIYCINQDHLRKDFEYLKTNGYNVVSCKDIFQAVESGRDLPDKAVLLTFDDGYLNNLKYAAPLLAEYKYSGLFSVVGDYTRLDKTSNPHGGDFTYFGWQDIATANEDEFIEIGLHSFALHNTRPRLGVAKKAGESEEEYKKFFSDDTDRLISRLDEIGVRTSVYAYPYGKYCKESEDVLKEKGITMTLTCNEGVNRIYGKDSLYLLKRFNRDATKGSLSEIIGKA